MNWRTHITHEPHDSLGGISRMANGRCIECLGETHRLSPVLAGGAHWFLHYTCEPRFLALHVGKEVKE